MLDDVNKNPATSMGENVSTVHTLHKIILHSQSPLVSMLVSMICPPNPSTMRYHEKERMGIGLERGIRRIRMNYKITSIKLTPVRNKGQAWNHLWHPSPCNFHGMVHCT